MPPLNFLGKTQNILIAEYGNPKRRTISSTASLLSKILLLSSTNITEPESKEQCLSIFFTDSDCKTAKKNRFSRSHLYIFSTQPLHSAQVPSNKIRGVKFLIFKLLCLSKSLINPSSYYIFFRISCPILSRFVFKYFSL